QDRQAAQPGRRRERPLAAARARGGDRCGGRVRRSRARPRRRARILARVRSPHARRDLGSRLRRRGGRLARRGRAFWPARAGGALRRRGDALRAARAAEAGARLGRLSPSRARQRMDAGGGAARMSVVEEATRAQRRAASPEVSAWVAASAGSGKTQVLTDRVLNLLLEGTPPGRILCLTFTKAAAAEMAIRLGERLRHWATQPDRELEKSLFDLTGAPVEPELVARARRLFARVLDAPGGIPIQTIHSFCQSLLARFPLEAGVVPHFELLDERGEA